MSTYITKFYSKTVFQTANELEVKQKLDELIQHHLDDTGKFVDPDFGPTVSDPKGECSIFYPPDESIELQGDHDVGALNNIAGLGIDMLKWQRPSEFCKDPAKCDFIVLSESESEDSGSDESAQEHEELMAKLKAVGMTEQEIKDKSRGASSLDVMQGNLGDCWFISALALIAIRDDVFQSLICEERFPGYDKYGLYVFRMVRNCKVHYVVVDNQVPCMERSNGQCIPAFARNRNPNEYWVALTEKAYAKLNVRYINLTSGFIDEALQDLSGLAPEMIRFNAEIDKEGFWNTLKSLSDSDSLIGASLNFLGRRDIPDEMKRELQTEARHHGIQYGHAYGVLDIREVKDPEDPSMTYRFLRIKNPWGKDNNMEWNGDWCDTDDKWTEGMKKSYNDAALSNTTKVDKDEMIHVWGRNDNIFIMGFDDFLTYFNTLMAVRDFPDEWSGIRYYTAWSPSYGMPPRGKTWYKNPQFAFYLKNTTQVSIRLQQPDPRSIAENRPPFKKMVMLIVVFKIDNAVKSVEEFDPKKIALQSQGADSRSVMVSGELKPGKYCIVLLNAAEGSVSECFLSIYFNCSKNDIVFENKNWEVIREEEEAEESKVKAEVAKGKVEEVKGKVEETKGKVEESKGKTDEVVRKEAETSKPQIKKPETTGALKESTGKEADPKASMVKNEPKVESTFKPTESVKPNKPQPSSLSNTITKPVTYTQAIKELKKGIQESIIGEDENRIVDPLALEIQFETELAVLFGLSYPEYKQFYAIPTEQQEKIIEEYNVDKARTSTVLDLSHFNLGNKGLIACFGGIEDYPQLEYLYLKNNKLGDTAICDLCRRLDLSRQLHLKEIDISDNPDVTDTSALALISLATAVKGIVRIEVGNTSITVKTLQKMIEVCERNRKLVVS